jgi:hypothetical protein
MQTALLAHSSKSTTTFTDDLLVGWLLGRVEHIGPTTWR